VRRLRFNISHTRGFVACAIARDEVGMDVEASDRPTDSILPTLSFAPEEARLVKSAPPERRACMFFRFWTLKEAFIKATCEGLMRPLDSFSFHSIPFGLYSIQSVRAHRAMTIRRHGNSPNAARHLTGRWHSPFSGPAGGRCDWTRAQHDPRRSRRATTVNVEPLILRLQRPAKKLVFTSRTLQVEASEHAVARLPSSPSSWSRKAPDFWGSVRFPCVEPVSSAPGPFPPAATTRRGIDLS
jgi:4'-phosphopantetheinyl transferase superfamily